MMRRNLLAILDRLEEIQAELDGLEYTDVVLADTPDAVAEIFERVLAMLEGKDLRGD